MKLALEYRLEEINALIGLQYIQRCMKMVMNQTTIKKL